MTAFLISVSLDQTSGSIFLMPSEAASIWKRFATTKKLMVSCTSVAVLLPSSCVSTAGGIQRKGEERVLQKYCREGIVRE